MDCGEDFTAFLTLDGGVFTCGSGRYGQLGHGDNKDEMLPRKVYIILTICYFLNYVKYQYERDECKWFVNVFLKLTCFKNSL